MRKKTRIDDVSKGITHISPWMRPPVSSRDPHLARCVRCVPAPSWPPPRRYASARSCTAPSHAIQLLIACPHARGLQARRQTRVSIVLCSDVAGEQSWISRSSSTWWHGTWVTTGTTSTISKRAWRAVAPTLRSRMRSSSWVSAASMGWRSGCCQTRGRHRRSPWAK